MVNIPQDVFDKYRETCDDFISSNFGVNCKLMYPSRRVSCANCVYDAIGKKSANRYKSGGPMPFSFGNCPTCGGAGYREEEQSEIIKLRVYSRSQDFKKIAGSSINVPDGGIMVIGFLYEMPKFNRSNTVVINSDQANYQTWKFDKSGEAMIHGLVKDRYFMATMTRA